MPHPCFGIAVADDNEIIVEL